ncbi:MAG: hypothetical protein HC845_12595 [Akkermansiaceae bacterium]|nr:hypothetical protein [Akkermansiaceae bacterium]
MKLPFVAFSAIMMMSTLSHAALLAGDIAIIGRTNNGVAPNPDSFAFVALSTINAGEIIYFTDNGWTGTAFRSPSATDGDGNENLLKWTAINSIAPGTIIQTNTISSNFSYTAVGAVPGGTSGAFADLALATASDQIYAFQAPDNLPLQNPSVQLFVLDDTNGFEAATSAATGGNPGLTLGLTAVSLNFATAGTIGFNTAAITSGTKEDWLAAIGNSANWSSATPLPSGSITVIPEPSGATLLGAFGVMALFRRRK